MAIGKGGSNSNQSGTQTADSTGTSSSTQTGASTGTQSVNPTDFWKSLGIDLSGSMPAGNGGMTDAQGAAYGSIDPSVAKANQGIDYTNQHVLSQFMPGNYQTPTSSAATSSTGPAVSGQAGAGYAGAYNSPYLDQVTNATMADLTHAFDKSQNDLRANYGGQGWSASAGAPAGEQVAAAQGADNYLRTVGSTLGGLRNQGFLTAQELAQQDAGRFQNADTFNSGQAQQNNQWNAGNQTQNNQFNAGQQSRADAQSIATAQDYIKTLFGQQGVENSAAVEKFGLGGSGLQQILAAMGSQQPAFGTSATGSNTGSTTGATSNNFSGSTTGSGSGKNGGISIG